MVPTPTSYDYAALPPKAAAALRKQATKIREQVKITTESIIETGRDLLVAKQNIDHGEFMKWVRAECGFTERTAQRYMRAAEFAEGKNDTVSHLTPAVLYQLSAKSAPPDVLAKVLAQAGGSELVSEIDVDTQLHVARHKKLELRSLLRRKRGKPLSKRSIARREAQERDAARARQERDERYRIAALSIIDTVGEEHAKFLISVLTYEVQWQILGFLRQEVAKLDADDPDKEARILNTAEEVSSMFASTLNHLTRGH